MYIVYLYNDIMVHLPAWGLWRPRTRAYLLSTPSGGHDDCMDQQPMEVSVPRSNCPDPADPVLVQHG